MSISWRVQTPVLIISFYLTMRKASMRLLSADVGWNFRAYVWVVKIHTILCLLRTGISTKCLKDHADALLCTIRKRRTILARAKSSRERHISLELFGKSSQWRTESCWLPTRRTSRWCAEKLTTKRLHLMVITALFHLYAFPHHVLMRMMNTVGFLATISSRNELKWDDIPFFVDQLHGMRLNADLLPIPPQNIGSDGCYQCDTEGPDRT